MSLLDDENLLENGKETRKKKKKKTSLIMNFYFYKLERREQGRNFRAANYTDQRSVKTWIDNALIRAIAL
jgi:hypothetical protein